MERTLIDMTVRPYYGGGARTILKAYKAAINTLSVEKLVQLIEGMNFTYPYHQAVDFYLSQAVYGKSKIYAIRTIPRSYKFYLDYEMPKPLFSREWNLFYPTDLNK